MKILEYITFWPHQWKFCAIYLAILAAILSSSAALPIVAVVSMAFGGLFVADFLVKIFQEFFADRSLIEDRDQYAVIVTGCDTGFGLHFAQRIADIGFLVYATVLFPDGKGAQRLSQHKNIVVVRLDVTKQHEIDNALDFITTDLEARKKTLWSLLNNAGVAVYSDVEVASFDHYEKSMYVNAFGPLRMCKAFLPLMRANKQGRIVNITSLSGRYTIPFTTGYSMSKHALIAFSNGLRCELKPWNISVHTVQPAFYQTAENFDDQVNGTIDQYIELWNRAPDNVKKSYGLKFRDARVNALKKLCYQNSQPIVKISEVADDVIDAVAGVAPQVCYTPNTWIKAAGRVMQTLPFELLDFVISPQVKEAPAEIARDTQSG